jgi:hypothetical protein
MNAHDLLAWVSLVLSIVGIVLFVRRIILWRQYKRQSLQKIAVGEALVLVVSEGKQQGPFTRVEAQTLALGGRFSPDALYWEPGMMEWKPIEGLKGL